VHKDLTIKKADLDKAEDEWDYLYLLLDKYYKLQEKEPDNVVDNFNNGQHSLMAYTVLDSQVGNGGFIQLIYNGWGPYVFESPLIETLRSWGLNDTPDLLEKASVIYNETGIDQKEEDTLDDFSRLYTDYPQFEKFDDAYYEINDSEVRLVKRYIEDHLDDFIIVE